ncbi:hypothetical protein EAG_10630, partial [Camponotus floridanus]
RINWSFISPRALHFGGLWKATVKIMKKYLHSIMASRILTYEEYNTLITEIEVMLNSRSLTPLTNASSDFDILTPSHF